MINELIMDAFVYPITDWVALGFFSLGLGFSNGLFAFSLFLSVALPMFLFGKCLHLLFSDKRKKYHWTKWQKAPSKCLDHLSQDKDIKVFLKGFLFFMGLLFFVVAMLKSFIILIPSEEGMHVLDMCTKENWMKIFQLFCTVIFLVAGLKMTHYRMYGIINSYKEFNYKMIFWM